MKTKEQYIQEAGDYVTTVVPLEEGGKAIGWIGYGLDMRDEEVAELKARIKELEG